MSITVVLNDRTSTVRIVRRRPVLRLAIDDREYDILERPALNESWVEVELAGRVFRAWRHVTADSTYVRIEGRTHILRRPRRDVSATGANHENHEVRAQMPGMVVEIHCAEGDTVMAGDRLVTTESMKLQCTHVAPCNGIIERVACRKDAPFDNGAVLVVFARGNVIAEPSPTEGAA